MVMHFSETFHHIKLHHSKLNGSTALTILSSSMAVILTMSMIRLKITKIGRSPNAAKLQQSGIQ
jgi:hypothetical protein